MSIFGVFHNKMNLQRVTWISLVISSLISGICVLQDFYLVNLEIETSKDIMGTIIGASGAFIGFVVIYLSISFENFKKIYGQYATDFFGKDSLIQNLLLLFILPILIGLMAYIFADSKLLFAKWLFNTSCFLFFIAILLLLPYAKAIIKNSSSNSLIERLVVQLTEQDFTEQEKKPLKNVSTFQMIRQADKSTINTISHILFANIQEKNGKNGIAILFDLFEKVKILLNDKKTQVGSKRDVATYFAGIIKDSFDLYHYNKDSLGVKTCLAATNSFNKVIAENKFDEKFIETVFDVIIYMSKSLIESESESLVFDAIWVYYHMSDEQLSNNTPKEENIWEENNEDWLQTLNTKEAQQNEHKFDKIDEFTSYRLNEVVERSFLCKNYHITEDCVGILGSFCEMIFYNQNLGPLQKSKIGSALAFHSGEVIKRFSKKRELSKSHYLDLYIGTTYLSNILEYGERYSKEVFDAYIGLIEFLIANDNFSRYDAEKLGGLCRVIISHSSKIPGINGYVEQILEVQNKLKNKCIQSGAKEKEQMIVEIKNDFKSYLSIMRSRNIDNASLKTLIEKYTWS